MNSIYTSSQQIWTAAIDKAIIDIEAGTAFDDAVESAVEYIHKNEGQTGFNRLNCRATIRERLTGVNPKKPQNISPAETHIPTPEREQKQESQTSVSAADKKIPTQPAPLPHPSLTPYSLFATKTNWPTFLLGMGCGLILGVLAGYLMTRSSHRESRFILSKGPYNTFIKMDTATGKTWLIDRVGHETEVQAEPANK